MATLPPGNTYHNIHISGNARVLLGNTFGQANGQSDPTFLPSNTDKFPESTPTAQADYTGQYANSSLRPVPNHVPRPQLLQKVQEQLRDLQNSEADDTRIWWCTGLEEPANRN